MISTIKRGTKYRAQNSTAHWDTDDVITVATDHGQQSVRARINDSNITKLLAFQELHEFIESSTLAHIPIQFFLIDKKPYSQLWEYGWLVDYSLASRLHLGYHSHNKFIMEAPMTNDGINEVRMDLENNGLRILLVSESSILYQPFRPRGKRDEI